MIITRYPFGLYRGTDIRRVPTQYLEHQFPGARQPWFCSMIREELQRRAWNDEQVIKLAEATREVTA